MSSLRQLQPQPSPKPHTSVHPPSPCTDPLISIRIVHIDHYTHNLHTYSSSIPFQAARLTTASSSQPAPRLPVIRIFGSTPASQQCCLHIHALRPYLHIQLPPSLHAQTKTPTDIYAFAQALQNALESTLHTAFAQMSPNGAVPQNRNVNGGQNDRGMTYIADIEPILASSIYGFSAQRALFLKISTYLPSTISRIATLFTHRALPPPFDTLYLPHEAHIPFALQFLTDYALAGMDYIHLSSCKFRLPMPPPSSVQGNDAAAVGLMDIPMNKRMFTENIREETSDLFWTFAVSRRSTATLELDAFETDILNPRMNETATAPGQQSGFVNRTLDVLWQEERLRTGVLPPRIVPKKRDIVAGAHLSPSDMRDRLEEVLFTRLAVDEEAGDDSQPLNDSESASESQNIPLSDVLNYLDSSLSLHEDDDNASRDLVGIDEDDVDHDDEGEEFEDKPMSIEQTWRDIAECTQAVKKKSDQSASTREQNTDNIKLANETAPSSIAPSPPPDTPRTPRIPYTPRTPRTRTPSQSQPQSRSQSQQQDEASSQTVRRRRRPPSRAELGSEPMDAWKIEWKTPFYSSAADMRSTGTSAFGYGGSDVRVRGAGAAGFPPFPLPFETHTSDRTVHIPVTMLTPVCKPPTFSQLRSAANVRGNWGTGGSLSKLGGLGQRVAIDSAGRMVGVREASATKGLSLTPSLLSAVIGEPFSLKDADELVQVNSSDHDAVDSEHVTSLEANESSALLNTSRKLQHDQRIREGVNSDKNAHEVDGGDDDSSVLSNQFLSPKYDETFQFSVKQAPATRSRSSSARVTPRKCRQSSAPDSALEQSEKNGDITATLSESPHKHQNISFMSIEILTKSFGDKLPDPTQNELLAVCTIQKTDDVVTSPAESKCTILAVKPSFRLHATFNVKAFETEAELFDGLATHIRNHDPDVLVGYETQAASIGFILERAQSLGHYFAQTASRWLKSGTTFTAPSTTDNAGNNNSASMAAAYYNRKGADVNLTGRHIISLWRIIRTEVKLSAYSREIVAAELFGTTFPQHSNRTMEDWYMEPKYPHRAVQHLVRLAALNVAIVDKLHVLSRTGELARVYGIDFMSVLTRGSQFRVESMMRRVAKARGFLLLSAARDQVFKQPAVEALPLVMEPYSGLYVDPVVVLDFQSLYPSVIIAHNLCFSTMLGNINRVQTWDEMRRVGVMPDYTPPSLGHMGGLESIKEHVFVASNGEMFVDASIRRGILPQMLDEILETRVMVKSAMKGIVNDPATSNLLNARQFGLKMIANVTYGYTSASFSGRMPCAGLADAIVQCGRDALEQICDYVDEELQGEHGARIVYGDTDSLFVQVRGATRAEAFEVGERIVAKAATMFPAPMALKLEKVYQPCVLQTKKRYVGYSYEKPSQAVPEFDAKGIETVRRDTCPLVQKALERAIRLLFETRDLSVVKRDLQRLCTRLQTERVPLADFVFRREVRLGSYKEGHLPPAAIVASKAIERDARAVPRHGERVPFVVIYEQPGAPLKNCVIDPNAFVQLCETESGVSEARLNVTYYITKQLLPALDRVFALVGARVVAWYADFPRIQHIRTVTHKHRGAEVKQMPVRKKGGQSVLPMFYAASACAVCRTRCRNTAVCRKCVRNETARQASQWVLEGRRREFERKAKTLLFECRLCTKTDVADRIACCNVTCGVYDELRSLKSSLQTVEDVLHDLDDREESN